MRALEAHPSSLPPRTFETGIIERQKLFPYYSDMEN